MKFTERKLKLRLVKRCHVTNVIRTKEVPIIHCERM